MKRNPWLILVLAASLLVGCSSEPSNNENNETNNGTTANTTNTVVDNTGTEYNAQYSFLFDSIAFNEDPFNRLNNLLKANFDLNLDFPVLILLDLEDIDAEAGTLTVRGGSGLKTGELGVYEYDPEAMDIPLADGTLDADSGEFSAQLSYFGFVATFSTEDGPSKTVLPINDLDITGQINLAEDGTATIVNGTIAGYLTKEAGDMTEITLAAGGTPVTLTSVFKEATLNYDITTNTVVEKGEGDAWFLEGTYAASETTIEQ